MIDNIYDHIIEAKIEAEKRMIEANTIIINKNLAFSDKGCIQFLNNITEYPPMIFGLKVVYANDNLPNNSAFIVTQTQEKLTESEKIKNALGIEPSILLDALEKGIIVYGDKIYKPRLYYSNDFDCYCFECAYGAYVVKLKDYNVTWHLIEEEE